MKPGRVIKISLMIIPLVWFGCAGLNQTIDKSKDPENHLHSITQTRSFGDQHFHAVMKYNDREGGLVIEFSNINEDPVKILRAKNVKALLTLPDGWTKEFYFKNPVIKRYPTGSRQAKKQLRLKPKSEIIYAEKDFLKDLSNFSLKMWLPVKGTTYVIKYEYPEPDIDYMPDAYFIIGNLESWKFI